MARRLARKKKNGEESSSRIELQCKAIQFPRCRYLLTLRRLTCITDPRWVLAAAERQVAHFAGKSDRLDGTLGEYIYVRLCTNAVDGRNLAGTTRSASFIRAPSFHTRTTRVAGRSNVRFPFLHQRKSPLPLLKRTFSKSVRVFQ